MCSLIPIKIVKKDFFINITNNNNELYNHNLFLIKKNNELKISN